MKLIALFLFCLLCTNAGAQDESPISELEKSVRDEIKSAALASYQARTLMRLDALAAKFGLSEGQLVKPRLFAKKVASDQLKECQPHIDRFLTENFAKHSKVIEESRVTVNGRTVANSESVRSFHFVVDIPKRWIQWNGEAGGSGSWLEIHEPIDFSQEVWRKPFSKVLSAEQLANYQSEYLSWERGQRADAAVKQAPDFGFSQEQASKIQEKIIPSMRSSNQSTMATLAGYLNNPGTVSKISGDFLSPEQKTLIKYHGNRYQISQQQGDAESLDASSLKDAVQEKIREQIGLVILAGMKIELEEYIRLLQPDQREVQKWRVLVKGIAGELTDEVLEDSQDSMESLLAMFKPEVTAFVWDGQGYVLADDQSDADSGEQSVNLMLSKVNRRFRLYVMSKGVRHSFNFATKSHSDFKLEKRGRWKKEMEKVAVADLETFQGKKERQMRQAVVDVVTAALSIDLVLNVEQVALVRELVAKECKIQAGAPVSTNAKKTLAALPNLEFLSESQQEYLRVVKARIN